jgi:transcriptional regulator with PAS, ATPase and Fis domain
LIRYNLDGKVDLPALQDRAETKPSSEPVTFDLHSHLEREKTALIDAALRHCEQDRNKAAALLGISRASLYRELQTTRPKLHTN